MKKEQAYDFRKRMLKLHEPGRRNFKRMPGEEEFFCGNQVVIITEAQEVVRTAAEDLQAYLEISMGVRVVLLVGNEDEQEILFSETGKIVLTSRAIAATPDKIKKDGFTITVRKDGIWLTGDTVRGTAQAVYYLEDLMTFEGAPVVAYGEIRREPLFSPRMVHSAYGLDEYPDEYLSAIAHDGRDAILIFTKGVDEVPSGYLDFNNLIRRAAKYGLDVYAYSYILSNVSPESEEAENFYENTYGRLFRCCPGLRGVILVGESVEFPSKDPHVAKGRYFETAVAGIPAGKPSSGWYPCEDYPVWLNLLKRIIRKYKSDADIVFWTYNWGHQPKEARIKLIESLPTDISLQATFEMFENRRYMETTGVCADYTLSFEGPGIYFASEAAAAKKRGIRLYSMTNTGGMTWDFGVIPYEPMPYQWMRRYEAMRKAARDWGLCGIMESHHFGMYPSFISKLSKWAFWEPQESLVTILQKILEAWYGADYVEQVDKALWYFSEAIRYYVPDNADQYGAFRIGPAYPFCLEEIVNVPSDSKALFGNEICYPYYISRATLKTSLVSVRIPEEIQSLTTMQGLLGKGIEVLTDIENPNERLLELLNLGRYIRNAVITGIHAKKWHILKSCLAAESDKQEIRKILIDMEKLLQSEMENVKATIPLVEQDSRLGWEPSMLYIGDKWHLEWKLRQVQYVLDSELSKYWKCLEV